jgi:hypothetical protein
VHFGATEVICDEKGQVLETCKRWVMAVERIQLGGAVYAGAALGQEGLTAAVEVLHLKGI